MDYVTVGWIVAQGTPDDFCWCGGKAVGWLCQDARARRTQINHRHIALCAMHAAEHPYVILYRLSTLVLEPRV